jgi:outer membrane biosynthesis protein TonB
MDGGQSPGPGRAGAGSNRSTVVKLVAAGALLALAGALPVVVGGRDRSSAAVDIEDRVGQYDGSALTATTQARVEQPARVLSALAAASPDALPTTTTVPPPPAPATTEEPSTTTEATEPPAPPVTDPEVDFAPAAVAPAPTPTAPPPPPTTVAPEPATRTLTFTGGSVTVRLDGGTIGLVATHPAPRYEAEARQQGPGSLFVRFYGVLGWEDVTIDVGADGQPVARSTFMPGTVTYDAGY